MICRFYEFNLDNNFSTTSLPSGVGDCRECDKRVCKYCHDVNHPLTKHKFSWTVSRLFEFPIGSFVKGELIHSRIGVRLIHPSSDTIWVIKRDDDEYMIVLKNKLVKCSDLRDLNVKLKTPDFSYDGRDLSFKDFKIEELTKHVHNS